MELQQLSLGTKIKMKLEQPTFICSGRDVKECYYRGTIVGKNENDIIEISFKYKGNFIVGHYNIILEHFMEEYLRDIKIIS